MADQPPRTRYVAYMPHDQAAPTCPVYLDAGAEVATLIQAIKSHYHFGSRVKSEDFFLYKCGTLDMKPRDCEDAKAERYKKAMEWLHFENSTSDMDDTDPLEDHFPNGSSAPGMIDLIIATVSILESDDLICALPDANNAQLIKRSIKKASNTDYIRSPSDIITNPRYLKDCVEHGDIHMHRPASNFGPHTSLFHPAFARLKYRLDHLDDDAIWTGDLEPDHGLLAISHSYFIDSCNVYENEEARIPFLKFFFEKVLQEKGVYGEAIESGSVKPNGVWGIRRHFICEEKNEDGSKGNASVQGIISYRKIIALETSKPYVMRTNYPAIIVGVMGTRIEVSTAIYIGGVYSDKLISQELYVDAFQAKRVLRLGRTAMALRHCYKELDRYYRSVDLVALPTTRHLYPAPLPVEGSAPVPTLEYIGKLTHGGSVIPVIQGERKGKIAVEERPYAIYRAALIVPDGNKVDVVVKFTARYNDEAHRLLENAGLAPNLRYFTRLVSGHYMVVTDYVDSPPLSDVPKQENYVSICQRVKEALDILHKENLVFGDLRPQNIVLDSGRKPLLIDFDVTGTHDVDRYPASWDTNKYHPEVRRNGIMRKEHDIHSLGDLERIMRECFIGIA